MTFAAKVKNELCKANQNSKYDILQLYGILLFSRSFKYDNISFYTENRNVCDCVIELITKEFGCIIDIISSNFKSNTKKENIILKIPYKTDREKILNRFGHKINEINLKINNNMFKSKNDIKFFLKGAFISCGTITNPQNGYHLEFSIPFMNLSNDLYDLLNSLKDIKIKVKTTTRKGSFILYIKDSADITDFLTYIGAPSNAMELIQIKMLKEVRNYVNRTTNFETANISKTAAAAAMQIEAINTIKKKGRFNCLSDDLKELAELRLDNPQMSLRELGENLSIPLTRSGVNHKIKKIIKLYNNI